MKKFLYLTLILGLYPNQLFRAQSQEKLIIVNEGLWQTDNGRLTYFEDGEIISNQWFRDINGYKLGDTPNDIIRVTDSIIAIAMNWSNIVQFISPEGKALGATEDVPNNRKLASDGKYVYVTSYGHEVTIGNDILTFEKGYVAKIDVSTFKTVGACETGYEPEGIAFYKGKLFVANTGGYAFQENHEYETTVSVIDAETMELIREIDTQQINLYGKLSQSGKYLCINSPGDYYTMEAATLIMDCEAVINDAPDEECFIKLDMAATYNTTDQDGNFITIGPKFSYLDGNYKFNYLILNPEILFETVGEEGIDDSFPGTVLKDLKEMNMVYGIYVNPFTGYIYATDAGAYTEAGKLYQWDAGGNLLGTFKTYINPAHFLALPPDDTQNYPDDIGAVYELSEDNDTDTEIYDLMGNIVKNPIPGTIYIKNHKKFIFTLSK